MNRLMQTTYHWVLPVFLLVGGGAGSLEANSTVDPGTIRLTHTLELEGIFQRRRSGWSAIERPDSLNKTWVDRGNGEKPWTSDFGQRLRTEFETQLNPDVFARFLLDAQGEYADRFWRPININHHLDQESEDFLFREVEGRVDKENWYIHGFQGVAHADWRGKGDFFGLYPDSYPMRDYLGSSGYFGLYPDSWQEDQFLNITRRHIPRGGEAGFKTGPFDGAVALGSELAWGADDAVYGRAGSAIGRTKLSFVYKNEEVDFSLFEEDERDQAYALSWFVPFKGFHQVEVGVLYNPFRVGKPYQVADEVAGGTGVQGSSFALSQKTARKEDALGGRVRYQRRDSIFGKGFLWALDLTRQEILAGNKEQIDFSLGTKLIKTVEWNGQYIYRRPIEGPVPFLFEGTPDNIGAVVSSPRGPESPFWVDWTNREAVFVLNTFTFDPTPGTRFTQFEPHVLSMWNMNPEEEASLAFGVQHRMSDYRTATDLQYYYDENGDVTWESAAGSGAWASDHPLHEVRFLSRGMMGNSKWVLGVAGGQSPAFLGLAYTNSTESSKALTEYFSVEGRWEIYPVAVWGHYGSGLWGPEENIHPFFGSTYDRVYGIGTTVSITRRATWELNYLAARQDDNLFVSSDLGSFDEIRSVLSYRFGFIFNL